MADRYPGPVAIHRKLLGAQLAAQRSYRASFALDLVGQGLIVLLEFVEVYAVFTRVPVIGGFTLADVLVVFGLSSVGFALADMAVGQIDRVNDLVRTGRLDLFLVRPLPVLTQIVTSDFQLRRLGRVAVGGLVLVLALGREHLHWTVGRVALLAVTPVSSAVVFGAVFVGVNAGTFWMLDGREFANAFTYGGSYVSQWPFSIFGTAIGRFFTFVVPAAFTAYLPALALLGRSDPTGLPGWLAWSGPLVAVWTAGVASLLWRTGVRHYVGAGN